MEEKYTLKTILETFTKVKNGTAKKRLIFDQTPIDGIGVKWVIAFFISLPVLLYIGIFNPKIFGMLGIAQAIIFYIVFLSMAMIMIFGLTFINNNKVIRQITPSWNTFFPTVDFTQVLSSGVTPYKDFFLHYSKAIKNGLEGEALHEYLEKAFEQMKSENSELHEAMNSSRNRR
jgi:hypothetical protein